MNVFRNRVGKEKKQSRPAPAIFGGMALALLLAVAFSMPASAASDSPPVNAEAPVITVQPVDVVCYADDYQPAYNTIEATVSRGTLSYQWYVVSSKVNYGGYPDPSSDATSPVFNCHGGVASTTYYYCVVTNTDPQATGSKVAVTVSNPIAVVTGQAVFAQDTWWPDVTYPSGSVVQYKGKKYMSKWWSLNDVPGEEWGPWEEQPFRGFEPYIPGNAYVGGEVVLYDGQVWRANWYTTSVPGTDDTWTLRTAV